MTHSCHRRRVAEAYERHVTPVYDPIASGLVERAGIARGESVLEIGAGTGLLTRKIVPFVENMIVSDVDQEMLDYARICIARVKQPPPYFVVADAEMLPFASARFDLIVANLTPLSDTVAALLEARRVLRQGGRLALCIWGNAYSELDLINKARVAIKEPPIPEGLADVTAERIAGLGFHVRREDVDMRAVHPSASAYLRYRRAFGAPDAWSANQYTDFMRSLDDLVNRRAPRGPLEVGWQISYITAIATGQN